MRQQQLIWKMAALVAWSVHVMPAAWAQPEAAKPGGAQPLHLNPDNEPTLQELKTGQFKKYYYVLPVQNAEPDFLAWQFDPAHNKEPAMITQSRRNLEEATGSYGTNQWANQAQAKDNGMNLGQPSIKLPLGVDCVLPLAAQHALLVIATPGGAREIQVLARSLDKEPSQVKVISQVIEISRDDAKTLGVKFTDHQIAHQGCASVLSANSSELLAALVVQHKAKIITAPNVTAISNLAASIAMTSYQPMFKDKELQFQQLQLRLASTQVPTDNHFYLATQQRFTAIPTLNTDGSIRLRYIPYFGYALTTAQSGGLLPLKETQWLDTTVTLEEDGTVAITGLHKPRSASLLPGNPTNEDAPAKGGAGAAMEWVVFLTARLERRIERQAKVPDAPLERLEPKPVQP